jgi:hypothetical protein
MIRDSGVPTRAAGAQFLLTAHGDAGMPVWGEVFRAEAWPGLSERTEVRGKLLLIVDYLEAIQE